MNFAFLAWEPRQRMPLLSEADRTALLAWLRELADVRERQAAAEGYPAEVFGETPTFLRDMARFLEQEQKIEVENREF